MRDAQHGQRCDPPAIRPQARARVLRPPLHQPLKARSKQEREQSECGGLEQEPHHALDRRVQRIRPQTQFPVGDLVGDAHELHVH